MLVWTHRRVSLYVVEGDSCGVEVVTYEASCEAHVGRGMRAVCVNGQKRGTRLELRI